MPLTASIDFADAAGWALAGAAIGFMTESGSVTEFRRESGSETERGTLHPTPPADQAPSSFAQSRFGSFFSSAYFAADARIIGSMTFMSAS